MAQQLLEEFEHVIESMTLVPSEGGRFEVKANGNLVYSKLQTGRHAEAGEVLSLMSKIVGQVPK